ncbi:glycosyltransferase family 31 protein [Zopfia rhizophila CBS 207.26]|uniref:Glycosyltransferase family 31 protein n=1 Tax=Zopfia rhizophila CBS 207.26 TaxID=1314779 RepID=A0A6A6ET09_9PEZI|nr:glycosyltransferase family 31 protein [Zopfia rhizophila CBS 207.26]
MPTLTPSRVAVIVLSLSLFSFLWTFGLPRQLPTPSLPNINHEVPQKPQAETHQTPLASVEHDRSFTLDPTIDDSTPTPTAIATQTEIPEVTGGEESNGTNKPESGPVEGSTPTTIPSGNGTKEAAVPTPTANACRNAKGASDVMVTVKTSATEIYQKLPVHLLTLLECVPDFAIFSDHTGSIAGHPVYDALEQVTNGTRDAYEEFKEHGMMKQHDQSSLPDSITKELDKWKILPMVYKSYKMHPDKRFYLFVEADTSISWTNLLLWVARLDYRIPYYSGAPSFIGSVRFAQRGSGILLSHGALKQYAKAYEERYESDWERRVGKECCGDMVLATALSDAHVEFYSAFPLLQGETPSTLDWTQRHWCAPVVSWHHISPGEIDLLWSLRQNWIAEHGWDTPYLFRNAFKEFVSPLLEERRDDWDNLSQDTKINKPPDEITNSDENVEWYKLAEDVKNATQSEDSCRHVCERADDCLQWKFRKGECDLGKVIRLGRKALPKKDEEPWVSGWMLERIKKATEEWGQCEEPNWKFNQ